MPKVAPEIFTHAGIQFSAFWRWFTWIGCLIVFVGIFLFGFLADYVTGIVFMGIWSISILYWFARKKILARQGIDIAEMLKHELPQCAAIEKE